MLSLERKPFLSAQSSIRGPYSLGGTGSMVLHREEHTERGPPGFRDVKFCNLSPSRIQTSYIRAVDSCWPEVVTVVVKADSGRKWQTHPMSRPTHRHLVTCWRDSAPPTIEQTLPHSACCRLRVAGGRGSLELSNPLRFQAIDAPLDRLLERDSSLKSSDQSTGWGSSHVLCASWSSRRPARFGCCTVCRCPSIPYR